MLTNIVGFSHYFSNFLKTAVVGTYDAVTVVELATVPNFLTPAAAAGLVSKAANG